MMVPARSEVGIDGQVGCGLGAWLGSARRQPCLPWVPCTWGCSRPSDTIANYTGSGLDEDPAVLLVGDVDSHLLVNGGFVGGVGGRERRGDVLEAGH